MTNNMIGEASPTNNAVFIGPRSDHSLPLSVTDSLTHSRPFGINVTALLKNEWPKYADHADSADFAEYAEYAE